MAAPVRTVFATVFASLLMPAFVGCKRPEDTSAFAHERLVVFAASSLRDAFTTIGADWQRLHPGQEVVFNFAGTQALRTQIEHGASADIFAAADMHHADALQKAGLVTSHVVFARNEPVIVVAKESVNTIRRFGDLPNAERIVLGVPEVPIGRYALQILVRASVELGTEFYARVQSKVVSRELNVRQVLTKVNLGEADAAFVYRSDAMAAGATLSVVAVPPEFNVIADYPIAVVQASTHALRARDWIAYVLSDAGQRTLHLAGFRVAGATP
ncbi:MAG: molybdate ABC transporter substrate-binding protein [Deltaproteobacteria bacterium]|nr:molybdate ABC transporter substrate-binding protein [Deltaproteobacteria bacterium]